MESKKRLSQNTYIAVDIKKKRILSLHVTSEQVHDGKVLQKLVEDISIKQNKIIDTAIMDGAYDSNKNFQFLSFRGIQPAIKVRKNAKYRKTNHYLRNKNVQLQTTIYNIGRIIRDMDKDGLQKLSFPLWKDCLENMLLLLDLRAW